MSEVKELTGLMLPMMVAVMSRQMAIAILRDCLGRDPTPSELIYYENQLWLRNLNQWQKDRQNSYQKIHDLAWRGN